MIILSNLQDLVQHPAGAGLNGQLPMIIRVGGQDHYTVQMSGRFDLLPVKGNEFLPRLDPLALLHKADKLSPFMETVSTPMWISSSIPSGEVTPTACLVSATEAAS